MAASTTTTPAAVAGDPRFLRRVLALDALASAASGLTLLAGSGLLEEVLRLGTWLTIPAGMFLLPWAAFVGAVARQTWPSGAAARLIVLGNVVWAIGSVVLLLLGIATPNALGVAFVTAQAVAVAIFAGLQLVGLRRLQ